MPDAGPEPAAPTPRRTLPAMDVAAFVGFAASGPIDLPVAVEDEAEFADVFGADAPLAWDPVAGAPAPAQLPAAVRAFFANRGQRCWVVRVAGPAHTQTFPLPGLLAWDPRAGRHTPAVARARSPGSWADELQVSTTLSREALALAPDGWQPGSAGLRMVLAPSAGADLGHGDLLRLDLETARAERLTGFLPLGGTGTAAGLWGTDDGPRVLEAPWGAVVWLRRSAQTATPVTAVVLADADGRGAERPAVSLGRDDGTTAVRIAAGSPPVLAQAGMVLPLRLEGGGGWAFLAVEETRTERVDGAEWRQTAVGRRLWQAMTPPDDAPQDLALRRLERMSFGIGVQAGGGRRWRLANLGLGPAHPRRWAELPDDAALYPRPDASRPQRPLLQRGSLVVDAARPRFPLAGPEGPRRAADAPSAPADVQDVPVYLPLSMALSPGAGFRATALGEVDPTTRLCRDGLERFDAGLFLDPELRHHGSHTLDAVARARRRAGDRPLRGIHAVHLLDEISLLAAPDAAQPGWEPAPMAAPAPLVAPALAGVRIGGGAAILSWEAVAGARAYLVEEAHDPAFDAVVRRERVGDTRTRWDLPYRPRVAWFRVRAVTAHAAGPWSTTVHARLAHTAFWSPRISCLEAPELEPIAADAPRCRRFTLAWKAVAGAARYRLEASPEPEFLASCLLHLGDARCYEVLRAAGDGCYYRVRAESETGDPPGTVGPWSVTRWLAPAPPVAQQMRTAAPAPGTLPGLELLDVHLGLLRLGCARGDVLSVLSLPRGSGMGGAVIHRRALGDVLGPDEQRALSYGALYMPWLQVASVGDGPRVIVPDGAVLGTLAARARSRGPWVSPTNEALRGVTGLEAVPDEGTWDALFRSHVNLIRHRPRGFMAMGADTLSEDAEIRPIYVRRLMMLLRRLALRDGNLLVMEPDEVAFRHRLQLLCEGLMSDLYVRGAFAGARPECAYQVLSDLEATAERDVDAGHLVLELRVAPAHPREFLTLRLVRVGAETLSATEL